MKQVFASLYPHEFEYSAVIFRTVFTQTANVQMVKILNGACVCSLCPQNQIDLNISSSSVYLPHVILHYPHVDKLDSQS